MCALSPSKCGVICMVCAFQEKKKLSGMLNAFLLSKKKKEKGKNVSAIETSSLCEHYQHYHKNEIVRLFSSTFHQYCFGSVIAA